MILIVTIKDDLHAINIKNKLAERGFTNCYILECDRLSAEQKISWRTGHLNNSSIQLGSGIKIDIRSIGLIWWRRVRADQQLDNNFSDLQQVKLINNDCRGALGGVLEADFQGKWLSDPAATDRAGNKIYQLSIAKKCGFRIPETLISQSKEEVEEFTSSLNGQVIVKPVVGAPGPIMFTEFIGNLSRLPSKSFEVCPAVYQEYIDGTHHIRLNCFGDHSYAALIETSDLDWRPNLSVPIHPWIVPDFLHEKVRNVLDHLSLDMGIVDIKRTPEGEFVWLEVNPQGQFLFLEPLTNLPLTSIFAEYLLSFLS